MFQNVHLVARWLATLERKLEEHSTTAHESYRVYISAEPAGSPEFHIIPQVINAMIGLYNTHPIMSFPRAELVRLKHVGGLSNAFRMQC